MPSNICLRVILAVAFLLLPIGAEAQILIVYSNVPRYPANSELMLDQELKLKGGDKLRILLPSGVTKTLTGPGKYQLKDFDRGQPWLKPLLHQVKEFLTGRSTENIAATRDANLKRLESVLLSWTAVPVPTGNDNTICLIKDTPLHFSRLGARPKTILGASDPALQLSVNRGNNQVSDRVEWKQGEELAPWPSQVPVIEGVPYAVESNFADPSRFKIKLLTREEVEGEQLLPVLFANGCKLQINAYVDHLRIE
jgi:hypothetical protein